MNNFICSNCGASYYTINHLYSTAKYCPPVYKDGKLVSVDNNYHTYDCTCLACHHNFTTHLLYNDQSTQNNGEAEVLYVKMV